MKVRLAPLARVCLLVIILLHLTSGCGPFGREVISDRQEVTAQGGNYLDFADVKVPGEMTVDREGSFIYENESLKAGMLNLTGRLSMADVLAFFHENMPKDGWQLISTFTYQKNILLFTKNDRVCLIVAQNPSALKNLNIEVWLAPARPGSPPRVVVPEGGMSTITGGGQKVPAKPLVKAQVTQTKRTNAPREENLAK